MTKKKTELTAGPVVESRIFMVRGKQVMLDKDLAELYGVETKKLNQAVKRNLKRFPSDFMFRLTASEFANLKSQSVMSSAGAAAWGGRRKLPYGFTEQGVAMLSSVLNSPRAIRVNIEIMRAFVQMRQVLRSHADLSLRLDDLELRFDGQFGIVFDAIRQLMIPPEPPKRRIGFQRDSPELS